MVLPIAARILRSEAAKAAINEAAKVAGRKAAERAFEKGGFKGLTKLLQKARLKPKAITKRRRSPF